MIEPATVVSLRALGLGDFLTGVPALRALERAFPESRHVLAAPSTLSGLACLAGLQAEIIDTRSLSQLPPILGTMPRVLAVDLHGNGPASHNALLSIGPEELIAFHKPDIGNTGPVWDGSEHEVQRWCRLLEWAGIPADPTDLTISAPHVAPESAAGRAAVIHPGAKSEARRWPTARWAEVAARLTEWGRKVIVTGNSQERPRALELARVAGLSPDSVVAGLTDLTSLAAIVANAHLVLSGDTGIAHLASALQTPSVVLFGPTDPATWGPPSSGPHVVLWKGTTGDPHGDTPDPGLLAITAEEVISATKPALLAQPFG